MKEHATVRGSTRRGTCIRALKGGGDDVWVQGYVNEVGPTKRTRQNHKSKTNYVTEDMIQEDINMTNSEKAEKRPVNEQEGANVISLVG